MRIETNTQLVQRNKRNANYLFFFSVAVLIGGFLLANLQLTAKDPTTMTLSVILPWIVLPIGFIATMTSVKMTNLWIRKPRPEEAIPEGLKGLSNKSVLYNYYHLPARHVLIAPQGVFAMITRFQEGSYAVNGDKWTTRGGPFNRIFSVLRRDAIGDPTVEAQRAADHVKKLLQATAPDVEVQPLIIFVDPRANVEITDPTIPVLYANGERTPNLREYLREITQKQLEKQQDQNPTGKKKGDKEKQKTVGIVPEVVADALEEATIVS